MDQGADYERQCALLVRVLPVLGKESRLALYGGTAINFFLLDSPRLSVDLDLKYAVSESYRDAQAGIRDALQRICDGMKRSHPGTGCELDGARMALRSADDVAGIKVEVNPVDVGSAFANQYRRLSAAVAGKYRIEPMAVQLLSTAEIYAGKVAAMLERTHLRDLYDVQIMNPGIWDSEEFWSALVLSLVMGRQRDPHKLFEDAGHAAGEDEYRQFEPMMRVRFSRAELERAGVLTRRRVVGQMPDSHRRLLVDAFLSRPDWSAAGIDIANLPGLLWRMEQIDRMPGRRREEIVASLRRALGL